MKLLSGCGSIFTVKRCPVCELKSVFASHSAKRCGCVSARQVVGPSTTTQTLSTDNAYLLNLGTTVATTARHALIINGIAPVTFTNAGTVISSTDGTAAGFGFHANGSLVNQSTGIILGHTYGISLNQGGNVTNYGDISARVSHATARR